MTTGVGSMSREVSLCSLGGLFLWFLQDAYLYEWLAAGILIVINLTVPMVAIKPVDRYYSPVDQTLSYPKTDNTISNSVLFALVFAFPIAVYLCASLYKKSFHDL